MGVQMTNDLLIRIRNATYEDCELIAEICESSSFLYDSIMPGAFARQAEKFRSKGLPSGYDVSVIEYENQIAGFIGTVEFGKKILYLVAIYLHQTSQRSGVGSTVLRKLVKHYRSDGYDEIVLLVHKEASWAKSFYIKNNFEYLSNKEQEIKAYSNGILSNLYIPNTELLSLSL